MTSSYDMVEFLIKHYEKSAALNAHEVSDADHRYMVGAAKRGYLKKIGTRSFTTGQTWAFNFKGVWATTAQKQRIKDIELRRLKEEVTNNGENTRTQNQREEICAMCLHPVVGC